jgi:flagellar basal-body rod protein FlgG
MRALAIAATGMSAQEQNLEVIANNIANINTTGFKRSRAEFTDLIYQTERLMGVSNRGRDATIPEGAQIGLGVRTAAVRSVNIQGALTNTGNTLDLAINGRGWFEVTTPNGDTVYTRDGAFNTNANGQLVTMDGYTVTPPILVPSTATAVTISQTGLVSATIPGQTTAQQRSAAITSSRPRHPASRPSAFPATPLSASFSRATSRLRTSIRSPRSPTSSWPSAPMR